MAASKQSLLSPTIVLRFLCVSMATLYCVHLDSVSGSKLSHPDSDGHQATQDPVITENKRRESNRRIGQTIDEQIRQPHLNNNRRNRHHKNQHRRNKQLLQSLGNEPNVNRDRLKVNIRSQNLNSGKSNQLRDDSDNNNNNQENILNVVKKNQRKGIEKDSLPQSVSKSDRRSNNSKGRKTTLSNLENSNNNHKGTTLSSKDHGNVLSSVDSVGFSESDIPLTSTQVADQTSERELVTEPSTPTNTINSPEVFPNDPDVLKNLVLSLQAQLKSAQTSQVYTRSILNVVQEKQAAQDQDMQILKDALLDLTMEQKRDRDSIRALEKVAEDNEWAISDLKTSNDQIRNDFAAFKALQLAHNETMIELEHLALNNEVDHDKYHRAIKHLQHEVVSIKSQLKQDKVSLNRLSNQFEQAAKINKTPTTASSLVNNVDMQSVPNNIPVIVPTEVKYEQPGVEGSGDKSNEVTKEFDKLASSIEEKHNVIGSHIEKILAKERKLEKDMGRISRKVSLYEGELAKVYTMFFNLSLQMANIEKRVLTNQQHHFQQDLQNLQHSFMNFTKQIFQKWHGNAKFQDNMTSLQNQQEIDEMESALEQYSDKIKRMEDNLIDTKAANQQSYIIVHNQLSKLNDTVSKIRKRVTEHNVRATGVFEDVSNKMTTFATRVQTNEDRITRMEVKVLNASLNSCEKSKADLTQDNYIHNLERGLNKIDRRILDITDRISKMDKGMSNLYDITDTQSNALSKIRDNVKEAIKLVPGVKGLQKEVMNFVRQLPPDCDAVRAQSPSPQDGSYLIHPRKSSGSAWVPCQFDGDETWTTIQRRIDGAVSFARTWDEYKYGFGDPDKEYWIGNQNLHHLTREGDHMLQFDMWDLNNNYWYAQYNHFQIDNEDESYSITIGGYEGNATDAMKYSNYMPFSTMDHDNDVTSTHCAKFYTAGWWYKHCHYGNLNGRYTAGIVWFNHDIDDWVRMQRTVMRIRPRRPNENHYDRIHNSTEEKDEG